MDLVYVDSSPIDQIGYDTDLREVHVIFKRGDHYVYLDCTEEVWEQFLNAASKGTFVNQEFRAKAYQFRKEA